jgi:cysteine desulfurase family protein
MANPPRIYLDNAATSWPKPEAVYQAVDAYQRELGVAVGRGATQAAVRLQSIVERCRQRAARLLGASSAERIIFTFNGTDSLNQAIHGLLAAGDHVVTSVAEHNSVLRPLRSAIERLGIDVTYLPVDAEGIVDPAAAVQAIRPGTKLVALTHISNVTGAIQPIVDVGEIAHQAGALFLVDGAQSAGHVLIDLKSLPVDLFACSGHKGLLGPLGTGLLYLGPRIGEQLLPLRQGGTGSLSEDDNQPTTLPDRYESGNHNAAGLVGLEAALAWIEEQTVEKLRNHEQALVSRLIDGLDEVQGVTRYGPQDLARRTGVVSLSIAGLPPQEAASILDQSFQIETRAGLHCAPRMHQALGTAQQAGTVRLSPGPFTTSDQVDAAVRALGEVATAFG